MESTAVVLETKPPTGPEPDELLAIFHKNNIPAAYKAIQDLEASQSDKSPYLTPTIEFLAKEKKDTSRAWGTSILQMIPGEQSIQYLQSLLNPDDSAETKRHYRYTRFFALRALTQLAQSEEARASFATLVERLWQDEDEDLLVQTGAAILLAREGREECLRKVRDGLTGNHYWPAWAALRALQEFRLDDLVDEIIVVLKSSQYFDHKYFAVRTLRTYRDDPAVPRALGDVVVDNDAEDYIRLAAIRSLAELKNRAAKADLLTALHSQNAEIRVQASKALLAFLSPTEAASAIVQQALQDDTTQEMRECLTEALRRIDRAISTEILGKELSSDDQRRAQAAETILLDLGGWAAMQQLSQRRNTLQVLDALLHQSEKVVRGTFANTIRQARVNFYFALCVNVAVVTIGLALVILAIAQLIREPGNLEKWILPGGTGVIGVLVNLLFNNPRQNARDDLTVLMNVNVIFLGFMRQVNEIDATFKHLYMESRDFGSKEMEQTVQLLERAMDRTLDLTSRYLKQPRATITGEQGKTAPRQMPQSTIDARPVPAQ